MTDPEDTVPDSRLPDETEERRSFIGAEGTERAGEPPRTGDAHSRELDEDLDAALACTFPASDPVGCIRTCRDS